MKLVFCCSRIELISHEPTSAIRLSNAALPATRTRKDKSEISSFVRRPVLYCSTTSLLIRSLPGFSILFSTSLATYSCSELQIEHVSVRYHTIKMDVV